MTQQLVHDFQIWSYRRQQICISLFGGEAIPKELQLTTISIRAKDGEEVPVYWYW